MGETTGHDQISQRMYLAEVRLDFEAGGHPVVGVAYYPVTAVYDLARDRAMDDPDIYRDGPAEDEDGEPLVEVEAVGGLPVPYTPDLTGHAHTVTGLGDTRPEALSEALAQLLAEYRLLKLADQMEHPEKWMRPSFLDEGWCPGIDFSRTYQPPRGGSPDSPAVSRPAAEPASGGREDDGPTDAP